MLLSMFIARINKMLSPFWQGLILVGLLALSVRSIGNTVVPPSPYWEEAALGYDAYSILQTGRDHHGNAWPIVAFPSFGDYKPSLYFYAVVPSVAAFGLNTFAVRFPAVLAGTGTVLLLYLFSWYFLDKRIAPWVGLSAALQPALWWLGRLGFEVNLATFFYVLGIYSLFWAEKTRSTRRFWLWSFLSAISLALTLYAYHAFRLLAPLTALVLWFGLAEPLDWKNRRTWLTRWLPAGILAIILVLPILLALQSPVVQQRFAETSIFSDLTPLHASNEWRALSGDTWLSRLFFHRYWFWGKALLQSYVSHFSLAYWFVDGDTNPRHTAQLFGLLYPWELATVAASLLAGLASLAKPRRRNYFFLLLLTFLAPVAAMITLATPHALRSLPLQVWLAVWSGWGLWWWSSWIQNQARKYLSLSMARWSSLIVVGGLLLGSASIFAFYFATQYNALFAQEWQYGYQEVIARLRQEQREQESLFVSRSAGRPAMYVWFYEKTEPHLVQNRPTDTPLDQLEVLRWQEWDFRSGQERQPGLHATLVSEGDLPEMAQRITTIPDQNGRPLWQIWRVE